MHNNNEPCHVAKLKVNFDPFSHKFLFLQSHKSIVRYSVVFARFFSFCNRLVNIT